MIRLVCWHEGREYLPLLEMAIASVHANVPRGVVVVVADHGIKVPDSADMVLREPLPAVNEMGRAMAANLAAARLGPALYFGADTLFLADVAELFEREDDLLLPVIGDPAWTYDAGIVVARTPRFWQRLVDHPHMRAREMPSIPERLAMFNELAKSHPATPLEGRRWSYVPKSAHDPEIGKAAIVHFRGPRKKYMAEAYQRWVVT